MSPTEASSPITSKSSRVDAKNTTVHREYSHSKNDKNSRLQIGVASRLLEDMLSTPFFEQILQHHHPRGFVLPKFIVYNGTTDPFDYLLHFWQMMTLDIRDEFLLCKVFPISLHSAALAWFLRLPPNSIHSFKELSKIFLAHYLCLVRQ